MGKTDRTRKRVGDLPSEHKPVFRPNCFGFEREGKCSALTEMRCEGCTFYKPREVYEAERAAHPHLGECILPEISLNRDFYNRDFTIKEASKLLYIADNTLYHKIKIGKLKARKEGRMLIVRGSDLAEFLRGYNRRGRVGRYEKGV